MKLAIIADEDYTAHQTGQGHPECPDRYCSIIAALDKRGLKTPQNTLRPRLAKDSEILLCHSASYFKLVQTEIAATASRGALDGSTALSTGDVQICPHSLHTALLAVGGTITAIDAVMEGKAEAAFCPVRPPGHHACRSRGMGFCLFNNAAIGARYLQQKHGLKRILIADWDVHHGNGTQDIFYRDPSVFYFSTHQRGLYPGTGWEDETGKGNILNCPIPGGPGSRLHVLEAFQTKLTRSMEYFQPEFILISAGFDGHYSDPLGGFDLTDKDFTELTKAIRRIAVEFGNGKIVSILEGGYNIMTLGASVAAHLKALQG